MLLMGFLVLTSFGLYKLIRYTFQEHQNSGEFQEEDDE